jgi:RimJ/RimL family protein N-acetyltransferase
MRWDPLPHGAGRVILRRLTPADLVRFQAYRHDSEFGLYQEWEPLPDQVAIQLLEDMSDIPLFPLGGWVQLGIADRQTNDLVGDVGVCVSADATEAEIGFTLAREAQGSGLGTEAVRELIDIIFNQTDVGRIVAIADERNTRADRLLIRRVSVRPEPPTDCFADSPASSMSGEISRPAPSTGPEN